MNIQKGDMVIITKPSRLLSLWVSENKRSFKVKECYEEFILLDVEWNNSFNGWILKERCEKL